MFLHPSESDAPVISDHALDSESGVASGLRMVPVVMVLRGDDAGSSIDAGNILDMWSPREYDDIMREMDIGPGRTVKVMKGPYMIKSDETLIPGILELADTFEQAFEDLDAIQGIQQEIQCIKQAIDCRSLALSLTPEGHAERPRRFDELGNSFYRRFERFEDPEDVDKAIEYQTQAVLLTPDGDADKPRRLGHLGSSHHSRSERLGDVADIRKAIEYYSEALLLTPDGDEDRPIRLNSLAVSYMRRFECFGELADVDRSIGYLSQAVLLTPSGDNSRQTWLINLGNSYRLRFVRLGEFVDVDKAVDCHTESVLLTPDAHVDRAGRLQNLGGSLLTRFERLGQREDVDKAIECEDQAIQLTPDDHPDKPSQLNNIGAALIRRFEHFDDPADVDKAIECLTQAVLLTPDGHGGKPARFTNLGSAHVLRFESLGELADIDKAIEYHSQAALLIPDGHADKPGMLCNLGGSYLSRFKRFGSDADLKLALSSFQRGAEHDGINPGIRLMCARGWAQTCTMLRSSPLSAYEKCMALVPEVIWLGATIDQRYSLLTSVSDLATEAASWAISVESYDLAIEWLEQGRSIVWNQILHLRTPLDDLSIHAPGLAERLKYIASQLEQAGSRHATSQAQSITEHDLETAAQHHRHLAAKWEKCLQEARSLPGFSSFMRYRNATELKAAATDGPVILVNTHSTRWDALIIFPQCDDVVHIPLVGLRPEEADNFHARVSVEYAPGHRGGRAGGFGRVNKESKPEDPFKAELAGLWTVVVKPVLDALACTHKLPVDQLTHVTWCATGPLAFAPLHAAGPYDGSSPNAFDLVISSYAPSLSALLASSTSPAKSDVGSRVLAIGQEETLGLPSLPCTMKELAAIRTHAPGTRFLQLDGDKATVDAVLTAMDEHSWVHLACHATQHPDNPAHSAFHLYDGNLTLEAITKRAFTNKGLAFLSACQTAKGDGKMPDEAVHLAAGMLTAGYPSVIATMWSIADIDGPEVAGRVYAELLKDGNMDNRGAARALHRAVAELRKKIGVESFERWVPFVHIGV